jgi:hypothetical protein
MYTFHDNSSLPLVLFLLHRIVLCCVPVQHLVYIYIFTLVLSLLSLLGYLILQRFVFSQKPLDKSRLIGGRHAIQYEALRVSEDMTSSKGLVVCDSPDLRFG